MTCFKSVVLMWKHPCHDFVIETFVYKNDSNTHLKTAFIFWRTTRKSKSVTRILILMLNKIFTQIKNFSQFRSAFLKIKFFKFSSARVQTLNSNIQTMNYNILNRDKFEWTSSTCLSFFARPGIIRVKRLL